MRLKTIKEQNAMHTKEAKRRRDANRERRAKVVGDHEQQMLHIKEAVDKAAIQEPQIAATAQAVQH